MRRVRAFVLLAVGAVAAGAVQVAAGAPAAAGNAQHDRVVAAPPAPATPHALDGRVYAIAQVGSTMLIGGSFTQVQPPNRSTTHALPYVIAFDATTGAINTAFAPGLDGEVQTLLPGPTPGTVYVGGAFNTLKGVKFKGLVLLNVADGSRVTTFKAPAMDGIVQTVKRVGNRLFVGGTFTKLNLTPAGGIATLDASTGVQDPYVTSTVAVNHNWTPTNGGAKAAVGVNRLDVTPDGTRLVAIGNFKQVDGQVRDQVAMWDLTATGAVLRADWRTRRYEAQCFYRSYDSYVRDVDISPDGSYFVVATTGGGNTTLCDTAARWEVAATGDDVQPSWVAYTGGDTLLSVAITGTAVYVGGHQRWMNNPAASDRAGGGSVPRPGLAALDPRTGMPLTWNPGRNPRGAGAYALLATETGLWVGSDTDWVGDFDYLRSKIAFFPLAGGAPLASDALRSLPVGVHLGSPQATGGPGLVERNFDGTTAGALETIPSPLDFSTVRGATLVGTTLYYGKSDGLLYRRTLAGRTFGAEELADPYNDAKWSTVDTGSGQTFRGARPSFFGSEIQSLTSLFYDGNGRLYYTLSGTFTRGLYWRQFSPDSGVVHNTRQTAAASFPDVSGAFLADGNLYWVSRITGNLMRSAWVNGAPAGTAVVVSGPANGIDWRARALFAGPQVLPNVTPTAVPAVSCSALDCTADGSGSSDADGTVTGHTWDWGDGATSTGPAATHTYAAEGTYTVTLTVTDDRGGVGTATRSVTVGLPAASPIAFRGTAGVNVNSAAPALTVPSAVQAGDALVLLVSTKTGTTHTPPAGWTQVAQSTGTAVRTTVWSRVAGAADAGSSVTVTLSELTKSDVRLLAYGGTAATDPVSAVIASDPAATTSHPAPAATVTVPGSWVAYHWADKSAATTTSWTAPAGVSARATAIGTGTTYLSSLSGDLAGSSALGTVPARSAGTNAVSRANGVTLVLVPGST